jgi:hypothetical protein
MTGRNHKANVLNEKSDKVPSTCQTFFDFLDLPDFLLRQNLNRRLDPFQHLLAPDDFHAFEERRAGLLARHRHAQDAKNLVALVVSIRRRDNTAAYSTTKFISPESQSPS